MVRYLFVVMHGPSLVVAIARNANEAHEFTTCTVAPSDCDWTIIRLDVELSESEGATSRLVWKGKL